MSQRKISMTNLNLVAKHSPKFNKPKTHRDKKKDYSRKVKYSYSYSNSSIQESYKYPDI